MIASDLVTFSISMIGKEKEVGYQFRIRLKTKYASNEEETKAVCPECMLRASISRKEKPRDARTQIVFVAP